MDIGTIPWSDSNGVVFNETDFTNEEVFGQLGKDHPEYRALAHWAQSVQQGSGSMFARDKYKTPDNIFDQFRMASKAAESDDIVSGVCEMSESLAFGTLDFEADDEDQEDIWNQIAENIDLNMRLKEMWRELFTVSQFYAFTWWGSQSFKVRGKSSSGVSRKKVFNLKVPQGITLLDPTKVMPVGNFMFGKEQLVYIADPQEAEAFRNVLSGNINDLTVRAMIIDEYNPSNLERQKLSDQGLPANDIFLLSDRVWRYGETRPPYQKFSPVRMKSVFELLDLKNQLRAMDRAVLIGSTSFIILVKKGSDERPAKAQELAALGAQVKQVARVPIIISDHRLEIEIITPKSDHTLDPQRHNLLDSKIEGRLLGLFLSGQNGSGTKTDDSIKLAKIVARGLESRRDGLVEKVTKEIIKRTFEMNDSLTAESELKFHPKRIALALDPAIIGYIQQLRDRGDISRETTLDEVGYDQDNEARKRKRESEEYDEIFVPTTVPYSGVVNTDQPVDQKDSKPVDPKAEGRNKGGTNPDSFTSNKAPVPKGKK